MKSEEETLNVFTKSVFSFGEGVNCLPAVPDMKMNQHGAFAFLLIVSLLVNDSEQLFGKRRKKKWVRDQCTWTIVLY